MVTKRKRAEPAKERPAVMLTMKGSAAWKDWVDELAGLCRTDTSKLIDMALVEFAKAKGFNREAPRR